MNHHVLTRATKSLRIRPKSEKLEITLLLLGSLIFVSIKEAATCTPSSQVLLWADEFNELDSGSWRFQYGDGSAYTLSSGWGNNELECYTGQPSNAAIITDPANKSNNLLIITAVHQNGYVCSNLQAASTVRNWTSAKLTTQGQKSFTSPSGKAGGGAAAAAMDGSILIQARIKVPVINGFWPSFLMLPEPNPLGGWCASGAIDIMTHVGASTQVGCGLQYGGVSGGDGGACVYESGSVHPEFKTAQAGQLRLRP
ncbi:hypothetical protein CEUSTIGMA_g14089.t1 [Chlamydomonas eustigma]|uniref:GH16 domain-containing protein n=1 Tax=Chlamydomonas eustigma TaxID=1157962 RepID=A0A250XUB2_9CHLO|nr:hypothetical protein CEUSTIGMA_g14089.t1 [Chlamydomonas eustigma]|eukprot:GAX86681.1 hypothetical protein CEUSTIGMA_g14089.t1 [Chlamydomonas eustigma]